MAETVTVALTTAEYTALSSTQTAAGVFVKRGQAIRLHVGASAPAEGTADYVLKQGPTDGSTGPEFVSFVDFGIGSGDEVYARAHDADTSVLVLRGSTTGGALPAGESHIGQVGGWGFDVAVTPTVTAGAYSAGDIMGGLLTFADVARVADEALVVTGVQIVSKAAVTPALTLVLFNADPTGTTKDDNAAYSLAAADAFKAIRAVGMAAAGGVWFDHGTPNSIGVDGLGIVCKPATGTRNLFGLLIDGTGVTLAATSDIQVRLRGVGA